MNDELISAYLDGELDAEKRSLAEEVLRHDGSASARMVRMRAGDDLLRRAFPRTATPADDPIAAMIMSEKPFAAAQPTVRRWAARAAALAAACVLGVLVGRFGLPATSSDIAAFDPQLRVGAAMSGLLDRLPSGASAPILGGHMQVALSVQTEAGSFCRSFRTTVNDASADVLACKQGGGWRVVAHAAVPADTGTYRTAAASASPIDTAIENLGGVTVLTADEELAQMARSWRPNAVALEKR